MIDDAHDSASLASIDFSGVNGIAGGVTGGVLNGVLGAPGLGGNVLLPPPPLRVGGRVLAAKLLQQVPPVYPQEAVSQDISGSVYLEATIGKQGDIRKLKVLSGDPLLAEAAVDAVQKWRYRPTLLNGNAVEVISQIEVIFALRVPEEDTANDAKRKKRSKSK
jgi:protein TonB